MHLIHFHLLRSLAALLFALAAVAVQAAPAGEMLMTNIGSTTETMISFRFQEHSWVTANGRVLVAVNTGTGIVLYGQTQTTDWRALLRLEQSGEKTTVDGFMYDDRLYLSWNTPNGNLLYGVLTLDGSGEWQVEQMRSVPTAGPDCLAMRPTVAADKLGRLWVAYTCVDSAVTVGNLALAVSTDGGVNWSTVETGLAASGYPAEVNVRAIAAGDGLMLIYTYGIHAAKGRYMYRSSAYRANASPLSSWSAQPIQQYFYPESDGVHDTYGTHFSALADAEGNVHMATVDDTGDLVYFRYRNGGWEKPRQILPATARPGYMQMSQDIAGNLYLTANVFALPLVFRSDDGGNGFKPLALLKVAPYANLSKAHPRIETPSRIGNATLPVFEQLQYADGQALYALLYSGLKF